MARAKVKSAKMSKKAPPKRGKARGRNAKKWAVPLAVAVLLILILDILVMRQMPAAKDFKVNPVFAFTGTGRPTGPIGVWDVAAVGNDRVVVTDQPAGRIVLFDRSGNVLKSWGKKGEGVDAFKEPSGVSVDAKGNIYVLDAWKSQIRGFDQEGKEILRVPLTDRFYGPRGVAVAGDVFYVADTGSHRVVRVNKSGAVEASWGETRGSARDCVENPRSVCVDPKGYVYVADYENKRIQVVDPSKKTFVRQIKCDCKPSDVAVDGRGRLFVPCGEEGVVKVFNAGNGKPLGSLVDPTGSPAPYTAKVGIDVAPDGTVILGGGDIVNGWKPAS